MVLIEPDKSDSTVDAYIMDTGTRLQRIQPGTQKHITKAIIHMVIPLLRTGCIVTSGKEAITPGFTVFRISLC